MKKFPQIHSSAKKNLLHQQRVFRHWRLADPTVPGYVIDFGCCKEYLQERRLSWFGLILHSKMVHPDTDKFFSSVELVKLDKVEKQVQCLSSQLKPINGFLFQNRRAIVRMFWDGAKNNANISTCQSVVRRYCYNHKHMNIKVIATSAEITIDQNCRYIHRGRFVEQIDQLQIDRKYLEENGCN